MKVNYPANVHQWGEAKTLVEQATRRLEKALGPSANLATVTWERVEDAQAPSPYRLTLENPSGRVTTNFSLFQLQTPLHMHVRLHRLWGDLLQIQSDQVHSRTLELIGQMTDADWE